MKTIDEEVLAQVKETVATTVKDGLGDYLRGALFGYQSPFTSVVKDTVARLESLPAMVQQAVDEVVKEPEFMADLKSALRKRLVNELVSSFNLGKRGDPAMRDRVLELLKGLGVTS